jgi:superoxide reductase
MKLYRCNVCGNVVELLVSGGGTLVCCGEDMEELVAKEGNESNEKHLPIVGADGNKVTVKVGSIAHPMMEAHYIQWIVIFYNNKIQRVKLNYTDEPKAIFTVDEDYKEMEVYEYCNIHGLWKTTYKKED